MSKIYNLNIDTSPLVALSANYSYDNQLNFQPVLKEFDNGILCIDNPLFHNIKDIKINKGSLMFLSSAIEFKNFAVNNIIPSAIYIEEGELSFIANNGFYITYDSNLSLVANTSSEVLFNVELNSDGSVSLFKEINYRYYYWTVEERTPHEVVLKKRDYTDLYHRQKFTFASYSDTTIGIISQFYDDMGILRQRLLKQGFDGYIRASGTLPSGRNVFNYFNYGAGYKSISEFKGYDGDSKWLKYYTAFDPEQESVIDPNMSKSLSGIKQNWFIDCPYKTQTTVDKYDINKKAYIGSMNINLANLKNVQTDVYEYATIPFVSGNEIITDEKNKEVIKRREYEKLFTGTNQEEGYTNPIFGFTTNTTSKTFPFDKTTYFHYPCSAPMIALSASGLIESGAIAGKTPHRSDKIWKMNANYSKYIWWGNSKQLQEGTWLCSWLSGSEDGRNITKPVWKDRWFLAGYFETSALDADPIFINNLEPIIWDEDSIVTLDPGVWYKYQHLGNTDVQTVVRSFSGDGTELKLHYDNWTNSDVTDSSEYKNDGNIVNFTEACINNEGVSKKHSDRCLLLNGTNQHVYVPFSNSYNLSSVATIASWIYSSDWNKINTTHILSKNYNGGWWIEYDSNFYTPVIPYGEMTYGHLLLGNLQNAIYKDRLLSPNLSGQDVEPTSIVAGLGYIWILDNKILNGYKHLYKVEFDGNILDDLQFNSNEELSAVAIDLNQNIIVCSLTSVSAFTPEFTPISSISYTNLGYFDIDLTNTFVTCAVPFCISNNNTYVPITTADFNLSDKTNIKCDKLGNYWILFDNNKFAKYNSSHGFVLSSEIDTDNISNYRSIGLTNELENGEYKDYVWIIQAQDSVVYKYDTDGNYITKIDLSKNIDYGTYASNDRTLMVFKSTGDFTGYDWQRKFKYLKNNKQGNIKANIIISNNNGLTSEKLTLTQEATGLIPGWHHFTLTFNCSSNLMNFYVDAHKVGTTTISASSIYYDYNNPFIIGGNAGIFDSLDTQLEMAYHHFPGKLDDIRIYNWELNNSDILQLFMVKRDFENLILNLPIGNQFFVEEVERFFKHKLPGSKSPFFNINLINMHITNQETRKQIEDIIKSTITKIVPAHTTMYKINWIEA